MNFTIARTSSSSSSSSSNSSTVLQVQTLAKIVNKKVIVTEISTATDAATDTNTTNTTTITLEMPHALCATTIIKFTGYVECIRALCQPEFWSNQDAQWLQAMEAAATSDDGADVNLKPFLDQMETALAAPAMYLCGETPSASDVSIALWIHHDIIGTHITITERPNIHAWLDKIKALPILSDAFQTNPDTNTTNNDTDTTTTTNNPDTDTTNTTTTNTNNDIIDQLYEWNIAHDVYLHETCDTAEQLVANVPIPNNHTHTKNLLFKDKKHGLFLFVLATNTIMDTKKIATLLGLQGKVNMRLVDHETLATALGGVKPGSVGPLCILKDTLQQVTIVLDQALMNNYEQIHSHPMRNDMSVSMTPAALDTFIKNTGHTPVLVDFTSDTTTTTTNNTTTNNNNTTTTSTTNNTARKVDPNKKIVKKGETLLALQWKKNENFPMWYSDVIVLSEMISYYDISGCYILRPWSYKIWELITYWFNAEIKLLGVENSYFPMFVSKDRLEKEKDHVEGFSPEVAWVTKSGDSDLAAPIAVRPTSETIMYPAFSDWIKSHRDLPLKLNQWSNVVRWEFKDPTPFLRTREFLWQEGHTVHATYDDANVMVMQALELYRRVYEQLLAVPVIKGYKTEKEKFAGGFQTTTVEAYVPCSGRAIQGATSHNLGQNFAKMFDIRFQDHEGKTQIPWQTSWGLTTRTIGVMVMVHGDDTGLVLPPMLSPLQVVIVPILSKNLSMEQANPTCEAVLKDLMAVGIRCKYDDREMYNPGWKYNHWEQKGVPLRVEVGPRDIEQQSVRVVVRFSGEKLDLPIAGLAQALETKLVEIQSDMFLKAKQVRDDHLVQVTEWKDFCPNLELNNLVLTPWCGGECKQEEEEVKEKSKEESLRLSGAEGEEATEALSVSAKTLCIPFDQPDLPEGTKCFYTGKPAKCWVLWGRSY